LNVVFFLLLLGAAFAPEALLTAFGFLLFAALVPAALPDVLVVLPFTAIYDPLLFLLTDNSPYAFAISYNPNSEKSSSKKAGPFLALLHCFTLKSRGENITSWIKRSLA
jgi:hypothetical protein